MMECWEVILTDSTGDTHKNRVNTETWSDAIMWASLQVDPKIRRDIHKLTAELVDPYRDDSFPPRQCDFCEETYQGPAVYCSLECAIKDA
jgi:hypothetical protein